MYYDASESYKNAISQTSRHFSAKLVLENQIIEGEDIYSIKYDGGSSSSDYLTLGSVLSSCLTVEIVSKGIRLANQSFALYIGLELADGSIEWLPMGRYRISEVQTKADKTTLQCQDNLIIVDREYDTKVSFPTTMSALLEDFSESYNVNVVWDKENLPDYEINVKPAGHTIREVLSMFAQLWGCFVVCDREGNIAFKWYSQYGYRITPDRAEAPEIAEDYFSLDYLQCYYDDDKYNWQGKVEEGVQGIVLENPYMSDYILKNVWDKIKGFGYYAAKIKCLLGDPCVDVWDMITVATSAAEYPIPVMGYTWEYDGGFSSEISAEVETATETDYRTGSAAAGKTKESNSGTTVYYASVIQSSPVNTISTSILKINFAATQSTVPVYGATLQLALTKGGVVDFSLVYDNSTMGTFQENCSEGLCIKTFSFPLIGVTNGSHSLALTVRSDEAVGTVTAPSSAYIMGSGLARNVAWDGTITIRENIAPIKILRDKVTISAITDNVTHIIAEPKHYAINEAIKPLSANRQNVCLAALTDILPAVPYKAYNDGDAVIYIDCYNSVYFDGPPDISAISVTAVVGTTTQQISVIDVVQTQYNQVRLTVESGSITGGTVAIAYKNGNLFDYTSGECIKDFVIAFTPS